MSDLGNIEKVSTDSSSNQEEKQEISTVWVNSQKRSNNRRQEIEKKYADETYDLLQQNGGDVGELTPEKEKKTC